MKNKQANTIDSTSSDKNKKKKNNLSMLPGLAAGALGLAGGGLLGNMLNRKAPLHFLNPLVYPELFGWYPQIEHLINYSQAGDKYLKSLGVTQDQILDFQRLNNGIKIYDKSLEHHPAATVARMLDKYPAKIMSYDSKRHRFLQPEWHVNMSKWMLNNPMIVPAATGVLGAGLAYLVARNIQKRLANRKKKENQDDLVDE